MDTWISSVARQVKPKLQPYHRPRARPGDQFVDGGDNKPLVEKLIADRVKRSVVFPGIAPETTCLAERAGVINAITACSLLPSNKEFPPQRLISTQLSDRGQGHRRILQGSPWSHPRSSRARRLRMLAARSQQPPDVLSSTRCRWLSLRTDSSRSVAWFQIPIRFDVYPAAFQATTGACLSSARTSCC
jgi:hypothetical protein